MKDKEVKDKEILEKISQKIQQNKNKFEQRKKTIITLYNIFKDETDQDFLISRCIFLFLK